MKIQKPLQGVSTLFGSPTEKFPSQLEDAIRGVVDVSPFYYDQQFQARVSGTIGTGASAGTVQVARGAYFLVYLATMKVNNTAAGLTAWEGTIKILRTRGSVTFIFDTIMNTSFNTLNRAMTLNVDYHDSKYFPTPILLLPGDTIDFRCSECTGAATQNAEWTVSGASLIQ